LSHAYWHGGGGFSALHMHRTKPTSAQDLSDATCIIFVCFVPHCREHGIHPTRFHTHDVKTFCRQSKEQMLAQSARLKADPFNRMGNAARHSAMSLTSHASSRSSSTVPLPSTMQSAQD
jgi:hypothetical protein